MSARERSASAISNLLAEATLRRSSPDYKRIKIIAKVRRTLELSAEQMVIRGRFRPVASGRHQGGRRNTRGS